jgi:uncharacterized protein YlzI (FlbEa/FlbD family)
MIRLTRLRNSNPLFLNPDHIERLEQYHETTVHLFNGDEFVVTETAEEIVVLITDQRARILALASRLAVHQGEGGPVADITDPSAGGSISSMIALLDESDSEER